MSNDEYPTHGSCTSCGTTLRGHREDIIPFHCRCGLTFAERIPPLHILFITTVMLSSCHIFSYKFFGTDLYDINYVALLIALILSYFYAGGLRHRLSLKNNSHFYVYGNANVMDLIYSSIYMVWDMVKIVAELFFYFALFALAVFLLNFFNVGTHLEQLWGSIWR